MMRTEAIQKFQSWQADCNTRIAHCAARDNTKLANYWVRRSIIAAHAIARLGGTWVYEIPTYNCPLELDVDWCRDFHTVKYPAYRA